MCRLERTWHQPGRRHQQVRSLITSLDAQTAAATRLADARGHWGIEHRAHSVRDVTLGEAASQVRRGAAPEVLAARRNAVVTLLRALGCPNIAAALRDFGWCPGTALRLLGLWPAG